MSQVFILSKSVLTLLSSICFLFVFVYNPLEAVCIKEFHTKGTFESPHRNYQHLSSLAKYETFKKTSNSSIEVIVVKPIHCLYKFIGQEDERVVLNFTSFRLRGDEPDCSREYVDMFVKFKSTDDIETLIGKEPSTGRFCSQMIPRRLISLHNMIVLVIHSSLNQTVAKQPKKPLFEGKFEFIKTKPHEQIGPPVEGTLCTHIIDSSEHREGEFQSITYPGVYVKGLNCSYKLLGSPGQRVRLEFFDLDLYSGGPHCPLDSVKIYDGAQETDQIINTICGSHRSLIVFSTKENLLITFNTMIRETEIQNRGFSANFEFSDRFVNPDFIQGPNAKHIRGSECDQRIVSARQSTGLVRSPTFRHHPNAICRYIFEGLQNALEYERVLLRFKTFNLKTIPSANSQTQIQQQSQIGTNNSQITNNSSASDQCIDNYVRLYTAEQKLDPNDYDYVFCGTELPQPIESDAASLLMEYNSGSVDGTFEVEYNFVVDYRIPGYQYNSGCNYVYRSDLAKTGTFNSPRYPSWLANSTKFEFTNETLGYNELCLNHDRVEMYELGTNNDLQMVNLNSSMSTIYPSTPTAQTVLPDQQLNADIHSLIGTFCGATAPGPILSYRSMRINFITNEELVHYGFYASYNFYLTSDLKTNEFVTNCGETIMTSQSLRSGSFDSPKTYQPEVYEKRNHICVWSITARPSYKIGLNFTNFMLEGVRKARGCGATSVRITTSRSSAPVDICGKWEPPQNWTEPYQFISESETLTVSFISTKLASGSVGFSASWFEFKPPK